MKTLELEQFGVQEMDAVEMKEIDGGFGLIPLAIGAGIFTAYLISCYKD